MLNELREMGWRARLRWASASALRLGAWGAGFLPVLHGGEWVLAHFPKESLVFLVAVYPAIKVADWLAERYQTHAEPRLFDEFAAEGGDDT